MGFQRRECKIWLDCVCEMMQVRLSIFLILSYILAQQDHPETTTKTPLYCTKLSQAGSARPQKYSQLTSLLPADSSKVVATMRKFNPCLSLLIIIRLHFRGQFQKSTPQIVTGIEFSKYFRKSGLLILMLAIVTELRSLLI